MQTKVQLFCGVIKTLVTARIRRMREGNIFSLSLLAVGEGGRATPSQVRIGGGGGVGYSIPRSLQER